MWRHARSLRCLHTAPTRASDLGEHSTFFQIRPPLITLRDLQRYGPPPLSEAALIESAEYTRRELVHRCARRVKAHQSLPHFLMTNPHLSSIYSLYLKGFTFFSSFPPITSLEQNEEFVKELHGLVDEHGGNIPVLAKGFQECARYLPSGEISSFLDSAIRNRISIRLIAEQHLSLSLSSSSRHQSNHSKTDQTKILDMKLSPKKLIDDCARFTQELCEGTYGVAPEWEVDGDKDVRVGYIGMHMEYILTELLKNSFRATTETHRVLGSFSSDLPPILITLSRSPSLLSIRIRDRGGGINPKNLKDVFDYAFTTVRHGPDEPEESDIYAAVSMPGGGADMFGGLTSSGLKTGLGTIAGLGYGLPLARLYARYFGGSLDIASVWGLGTDVFVTLRTADE
ncbi:alpha-ketoacid dehydrogenase kinase [Atractiella rhizophila]|nr:alpha-ketoacid dehydrogenase kinase [Atractiella rhizophila]